MCWLVAAAVVVGVFGTPLDCWAAVDTDAPLRAFIAARQDVQTHCPALDVVPEGTGPARIAVEREWDRLEDLIASKLRANRDSRFEFTMKGLSVDIVPLQADTDLVSANLDGLGTVFVVQKRNGAFRPVWSIHARRLERQERDEVLPAKRNHLSCVWTDEPRRRAAAG